MTSDHLGATPGFFPGKVRPGICEGNRCGFSLASENVSEYIRDLIRRDKERAEKEAFERLKAELALAFATPESSYKPLSAAEVIARNRI